MQTKSVARSLIVSALCFGYVQSAAIGDLEPKQVGVRYGIERGSKNVGSKSKFVKRDDGSDVLKFVIDNQQNYYSVNISVGTPPQQVSALLDTGSSDLWLLGNFDDVSACEAYLKAVGIEDLTSSSSSSKFENVVENDVVYSSFHRVLNKYEKKLEQEIQQEKQEQLQKKKQARAVAEKAITTGVRSSYTASGSATQTVGLESYFDTMSFETSMDSTNTADPFQSYDTAAPTETNFDYFSDYYGSYETATATTDAGSYASMSQDMEQAEASQVLEGCEDSGVYTPADSSSYKKNDTTAPFVIQYGDLTFASGWWVSDSIAINGIDVPLQFAVANVSNSSSVLGVSYESSEASIAYSESGDSQSSDMKKKKRSGNSQKELESFTYPNLPVALKNQGLIDKISYSLYLNSLEQPFGEILFGAVDSTKYTGQLYTIPLVNIYAERGVENPVQFDVTLQGTGIFLGDGKTKTFSTTKLPALLDSGTTFLHLPVDLAEMFAESVDAEWDDDMESFVMTCPSTKDQNDISFAFDMGGFLVYTPLGNYILETTDSSTCVLGIYPSDELYVILGDNFLSSVYVVYDLEDYEVSIAQANFDGAAENPGKIEAISSAVPSAKKAPMYSSTWSTAMKISTGGNIFTDSSASNPWTATNNNGLSTVSLSASGITKTPSSSSTGSSTISSTGSSTGSSTISPTGSPTGSSTGSSSSSSSSKSKNAGNAMNSFALSNENIFAISLLLLSSLI